MCYHYITIAKAPLPKLLLRSPEALLTSGGRVPAAQRAAEGGRAMPSAILCCIMLYYILSFYNILQTIIRYYRILHYIISYHIISYRRRVAAAARAPGGRRATGPQDV